MRSQTAIAAVLLHTVMVSGCGATADAPDPEGEAQDPLQGEWMVSPEEVPPGVWDLNPELQWSLEPEIRIGAIDGAGPDVFGDIRNLVPDDDGGVWIYDQQAFQLRHFGASGEHLRSVGRKGQGPGEFWGNACARPGADGEIWVETETNWHRFDSTGEFLGTFPTPSKMACAVRGWMPDGRYLAADMDFDWETRERTSYYVALEWTGETMIPVDTFQGPELPELETVTFVSESGNSRSEQLIPFVHNASSRLAREGGFWVWEGNGAYEMWLQSLSGDTLRRISRPYAPVPVDGAVRSEAIANLQRPGWRAETKFDASQVPHVYPPFASVMSAEDGSVWVLRDVGDGETTREVFSADDRYLGPIRIPESLEELRIWYIGLDYVWGTLQDDLDVQYVVRARIVRPNR